VKWLVSDCEKSSEWAVRKLGLINSYFGRQDNDGDGIGKPYHGRQFSSYNSAQLFLRSKGPAKSANKLGIAVIAKQYVAKGRVTIS
jgi:hypothetical protein